MGEAVRAIAALHDGFPFHPIKKEAHFLRRHVLMVQALDEAGNRLLKIDVVLPKRIVGVDEQGLGSGHGLCMINDELTSSLICAFILPDVSAGQPCYNRNDENATSVPYAVHCSGLVCKPFSPGRTSRGRGAQAGR